jgi:acyl dehydratase
VTATRRLASVRVGEELPELAIEITRTLIVAGAIASRDYQDVHHDEAMARERGVPGIFMNILTTNGLVGRFVTDWAGPDALVRRIDIRLGAPNFAGDVMRLSGRVNLVETCDGEGVVELEIRGRNRLGDHVTGSVTVALSA